MATALAAPAHSTTKTTTKAKATSWSPAAWSLLVLLYLNTLEPKGKKIPITVNNVNNLTYWIQKESSGNLFPSGAAGDWLRDNNPFNLGTYKGSTGAYGGTIKNEFGTQVNTFSNPYTGASATAQALAKQYPTIVASLHQNAPVQMFQGAVTASGWASGGDTGIAAIAAAHKGAAYGPVTLTSKFLRSIPADITPGPAPGLFSQFGSLASEAFTTTAETVTGLGGLPGVPNPVAGLASDFSGLSKVLGDLGSSAFWKRIGIGALGAALLLAGTAIFLSTTKPVQAAEGAAAGLL